MARTGDEITEIMPIGQLPLSVQTSDKHFMFCYTSPVRSTRIFPLPMTACQRSRQSAFGNGSNEEDVRSDNSADGTFVSNTGLWQSHESELKAVIQMPRVRWPRYCNAAHFLAWLAQPKQYADASRTKRAAARVPDDRPPNRVLHRRKTRRYPPACADAR